MNDDKVFLEFPLSALAFLKNDKAKLDYIISWCVVTLANSFSGGESHKEKVDAAADYLNISGSTYKLRCNRFQALQTHIQIFTQSFGKDAYCRMGKSLIFETKDGGFDFNQFRLLCAISSIIGKKKKFVRITYERIGYRMLGYKDKASFQSFQINSQIPTYKQLRRLVEILHAKKFFSKFTYSNRQMFFSTRLSDEELREKVKESKIYWMKKNKSIEDRKFTEIIKSELEKIELERRVVLEAERVRRERVKVCRLKRVI